MLTIYRGEEVDGSKSTKKGRRGSKEFQSEGRHEMVKIFMLTMRFTIR
jgi:hypothetical protein